MRKFVTSTFTLGTLLAAAAAFGQATAPAAAPAGGKGAGPCEQITQACESAGFVKGDAKEGNGLYHDCIDPIMKGTGQPANAKIVLPKVSSDTVAACKQKHPNFGEGKKAPPAKPAS